MTNNVKPMPSPLPATTAELVRRGKMTRTLNDYVEDIHLSLYDNNVDYQSYLYAVYDEQAVEGSLAADNTMASLLIREEAKKQNSTEVAKQKVASITKALGVVLRRWQISRKDRRDMLRGEIIPGNSGD